MKKLYFLFVIFVFGLGLLNACEGKHINELVKKSNKIYFYNENGEKIKNSYKKYNDKEYYFNESGEAITNSWTNDREKYADENGEIVKYKLYEINGQTYYFDEKGNRSHETKWMYFDKNDYIYLKNGVLANNGWEEINGKWYYFNNNGNCLKSQWIDNYYVNSKGEMCQNTIESIDGVNYYFDINGNYIKNYTHVMDFINQFIKCITDGGDHTLVLNYFEIISSTDNDIRFMYIVGDKNFKAGAKSYYEDYVKGAIVNNVFIRNTQPIYDYIDNEQLNKMQNWKTMASMYIDKCNLSISMENYINGNNGNDSNEYLVSDTAIPLYKNISKNEFSNIYNFITNELPQTRVVVTKAACRELIEMKNLMRQYRFSR